MNRNEKASSGAATADEAKETAALTDATISKKKFITVSGQPQGRIEQLLLRGEENAISTAELVRISGARDARSLQKEIERERGNGALILSIGGAGGGYYLPSDGEAGRREIALYIRTLRARALSTLRTIKSARRALLECDGQEVIRDE